MDNNQHIKNIYKQILFSDLRLVEDDDIQWQYIERYIPNTKKITVLDAGCGNGRYSLKLVEAGYRNIFAIDLFEQISTDTEMFTYTQSRIEALPYQNDFFDFIYSNSVIYYLDKPEDGIKEFFRVLKPGCIIIITAHTKYSLFTLIRIIKRKWGDNSVAHLRDVKFYSTGDYAKMFRQNGFKIVWIDGYKMSLFFYPLYLKCVLLFKRYFSVDFPLLKPAITRNKLFSRIKSTFAYHSIVVAQKL